MLSLALKRSTINCAKLVALPNRGVRYHDRVHDHYENPRNVGSLDKGQENVGTGLVGAPACGDVMKLQIEVNDDTKVIEKAVFKVSPLTIDFRMWVCNRLIKLRNRDASWNGR